MKKDPYNLYKIGDLYFATLNNNGYIHAGAGYTKMEAFNRLRNAIADSRLAEKYNNPLLRK